MVEVTNISSAHAAEKSSVRELNASVRARNGHRSSESPAAHPMPRGARPSRVGLAQGAKEPTGNAALLELAKLLGRQAARERRRNMGFAGPELGFVLLFVGGALAVILLGFGWALGH